MTNTDSGFIGFILGFLLTMVIMLVVLICSGQKWEKSCIEAGVGQYNSQTGEFEFIEVTEIKAEK